MKANQAEVALLCGTPPVCDCCGKDAGIRIKTGGILQYKYLCASCLTNKVEQHEEMQNVLEGVLHQLSTDSDLDDKVSNPSRYDTIEAVVRELVERVTGRRTTC